MQNFKPLAEQVNLESYLVENPEDRFSHDVAYMVLCLHALFTQIQNTVHCKSFYVILSVCHIIVRVYRHLHAIIARFP